MTEKPNICKHCNRGFLNERTLAAHMCTKKRRWTEQHTVGFRLGFRVFQMFYEKTTTSKKSKSEEDFINSKFYNSFIKFGRHLVDLDPINAEEYINFIFDNGVKLKDWTADYVYEAYIEERMKKEPVLAAIERTFDTMEKWAKQHDMCYNQFFTHSNVNEAVYLIRSGKISPWVLYLSETADDFFNRINEEQAALIKAIIDPNKWKVIFMTKKDSVELVKDALEQAKV